MKRSASRWQARRGAQLSILLGGASLSALASSLAHAADAAAAAAQAAAQAAAAEEILVTGSLIRGAPAVGVAVTALTTEDFVERGALTVSDLLKAVPSVDVQVSNVVTNSGGTIGKFQNVRIHNLGTSKGSKTVMLVNGVRAPAQGHEASIIDPSIIPQLAVDRIDVLADGASATYGSDAVAGVINVILKRNFSGAISQARYGRSWDLGGSNFQLTQLYGRTWEGGGLTVAYEWYDEASVPGPGRDYFTNNFEPYGYDDQRPIGASNPGLITNGAAATPAAMAALGFSGRVGTRACSNCYSIPVGVGWNYGDTPAHTNPLAPGSAPTTSWAAIAANIGTKNLSDSMTRADLLPHQERNAATLTFDQLVIDDIGGIVRNVGVFVDSYYSNRHAVQTWLPGASPAQQQLVRELTVPTTNPYFPSGTPLFADVRVSYDLSLEHNTRVSSGELAGRYAFGLNFELPNDWQGKAFFSKSLEQAFALSGNMVNLNMVRAAVGQTVPAVAASGNTPGQAAFSKPASIPYLNVFCDANVYKCNSQATMDYIGAQRRVDMRWLLGEFGLNMDGPVFELPGGTVRAAVGANKVSHHYYFSEFTNFNTPNTAVPGNTYNAEHYSSWAVFSQVNIPLVGEANALPLIEALNVELTYRYDKYVEYGGVKTPNAAANWTVGGGLTFRGAWGKSFRVPNFTEYSKSAGVGIQGRNVLGGEQSNTVSLDCLAVAGVSGAGVANLGSLTHYLNPTCSTNAALRNPAGLEVQGGAGGAAPMRGGSALVPETAVNWAMGFTFEPEGFLAGMRLDATYYTLKIDDLITGNSIGGLNPNDPLATLCNSPGTGCRYYVRADKNLPIDNPANAAFYGIVTELFKNPRLQANPAFLQNIQYIRDDATANLGWNRVRGLDIDTRYDLDLGEWGIWNTGVTANYRLEDKSNAGPGAPTIDAFLGDTGGRLSWRGRLGWTGLNGISVTTFINHVPHSSGPIGPGGTAPPACFWATGFSAGSCFAGSPYTPMPNGFATAHGAMYLFDLSLGYQTGTTFENEYLHNLNIQLSVINIFNKEPAFDYNFAGGRGHAVWDDISPQQRYISFAVTKSW